MFQNPCVVLSVELDQAAIEEAIGNLANYIEGDNLTVQLWSPVDLSGGLPKLSPVIRDIYTTCDKIISFVDVRVNFEWLRCGDWAQLEPDGLLLAGTPGSIRDSLIGTYKTKNVINLLEGRSYDRALGSSDEMVDVTVLGGTFDRIHTGHKILLTEAVLRASRRVVVGVTEENMTQGKKLPELILSVERRILDVISFLRYIDATLLYEVVPISDPFGPTAHDPDMDLIVVSQETLRGGQKVNEIRSERGLKLLKIHVIPLIDDVVDGENREKKVSSSNQRFELLGRLLNLPYSDSLPYKIAIVGAPKSGRTTVSRLLKQRGVVLLSSLEDSLERGKVGVLDCELDDLELAQCNEVWLCTVTPEAQKERAGEEQTSDYPHLRLPNVVISSSYGLGFMEKQVDVAWEGLRERLDAMQQN